MNKIYLNTLTHNSVFKRRLKYIAFEMIVGKGEHNQVKGFDWLVSVLKSLSTDIFCIKLAGTCIIVLQNVLVSFCTSMRLQQGYPGTSQL